MSQNPSPDQRAFCVGTTGGIASGKTTVCNLFADMGVPVIDADIAAREVVKPGSPGLTEIAEAFGKEVLKQDGELDRRALRAIVFKDTEKRQTLEQITHPKIRLWLWQQVAECQYSYCLLAVPLLIEGGLHHQVDRVLVVDISEQTQYERLKQRDGSSDEVIQGILAAQTSREARLEAADDVIDNNGRLEDLPDQVETLHQLYLKLSERR